MAIFAGIAYKPMALTDKDLKALGYPMPDLQDARIAELAEGTSKLPADFAIKSADYKAGAAWATEYITGMLAAEIDLRKELNKFQLSDAWRSKYMASIAALMGFKDDLEELGREIEA